MLLWDEVKDGLRRPATSLTLEQQQKLCIARLLPLKPQIILMDEPCSALDAEGTAAIERLMSRLRNAYTIAIVTHNMAQARRTSDECIFMLLGEVVEQGPTLDIFLKPTEEGDRDVCRGPIRLVESTMKQFQQELAQLKQQVLDMGSLAESMVAGASRALIKGERTAIQQVRTSEPTLDRFQVEIDREAIRLITIYAPVAKDLRFLLMIARINSELERIGDQAVDNCEYVELLTRSATAAGLICPRCRRSS